MKKTLIASAVFGLSLAFAASAADEQKPTTQQGETVQFKELDRSGDMKLTRDELPNDNELFLAFEENDLNGDGEISEYEFGEYVEDLPE